MTCLLYKYHSPSISSLSKPIKISPKALPFGSSAAMVHKAVLDYTLVPLGLALMAAYHAWLLHRLVKHPSKTVMGLDTINRRLWVQAMIEASIKYQLHNTMFVPLLYTIQSHIFLLLPMRK